jgi:2'-hydroxyisoflavone reductase
MLAFLEACRKESGSTATFTWAPEAKLKELGLTPEADFPIWASTEGPEAGIGDVSIARALKAGLTFRPLADTLRSTLAWWDSLPEERRAKMRAGLAAEKEAAALAALKAKAPAAEPKK